MVPGRGRRPEQGDPTIHPPPLPYPTPQPWGGSPCIHANENLCQGIRGEHIKGRPRRGPLLRRLPVVSRTLQREEGN
jgi:hypothetical protein